MAALACVAAVLSSMYLDASLGLGRDLHYYRRQLYDRRAVEANVASVGETCTLYAFLKRMPDQDHEALWFEGRTWTLRELLEMADRLAHRLSTGSSLTPSSVVAVFQTNTPEMVFTLLALSRIGCTAALLNSSLRQATLRHCLLLSTAPLVLTTPDLTPHVRDLALPDISTLTIHHTSFATPSVFTSPTIHLPLLAPAPTPFPHPKVLPSDIVVLIYTSGTTGLPKATARTAASMIAVATRQYEDTLPPHRDRPIRNYVCLPLFHGTALFMGLANTLASPRGCLCLARKFSVTNFWADCAASNATRMLYVGELCRYLLSAPASSSSDTGHRVRVAMGNGLKEEVWGPFQSRFGVREIREFYRSTDGIANSDNFSRGAWGRGRVGFQGLARRSGLTASVDELALAALDPATGQPRRPGRRARPGEVGEALGRVDPRRGVPGYWRDEAATEARLLRGLFAPGDCWQRTGDLLALEPDGWMRFADRVGDSFRFKGENVSAGEVRGHVARLPGVLDCVVWGAKLPGYDGQLGVCAVEVRGGEVVAGMRAALEKSGVPSYAVPRLVRVLNGEGGGQGVVNASFKHDKKVLEKMDWAQGECWYLDVREGRHKRIDEKVWGLIKEGNMRF